MRSHAFLKTILKTLFKSKRNKSCWPDLRRLPQLKTCRTHLWALLSNFFNICLVTAITSHWWKSVKIKPIPGIVLDKQRPIAYSSGTFRRCSRNGLVNRTLADVQIHDPLQLAYKSSLSTLDAASYIFHSDASLNGESHLASLVFPDYADRYGALRCSTILFILRENSTYENVTTSPTIFRLFFIKVSNRSLQLLQDFSKSYFVLVCFLFLCWNDPYFLIVVDSI